MTTSSPISVESDSFSLSSESSSRSPPVLAAPDWAAVRDKPTWVQVLKALSESAGDDGEYVNIDEITRRIKEGLPDLEIAARSTLNKQLRDALKRNDESIRVEDGTKQSKRYRITQTGRSNLARLASEKGKPSRPAAAAKKKPKKKPKKPRVKDDDEPAASPSSEEDGGDSLLERLKRGRDRSESDPVYDFDFDFDDLTGAEKAAPEKSKEDEEEGEEKDLLEIDPYGYQRRFPDPEAPWFTTYWNRYLRGRDPVTDEDVPGFPSLQMPEYPEEWSEELLRWSQKTYQAIPARVVNAVTPNGLMVWHSLGSGKTCIMVNVIEELVRQRMAGFAAAKNTDVFVVFPQKALADNFRDKFAQCPTRVLQKQYAAGGAGGDRSTKRALRMNVGVLKGVRAKEVREMIAVIRQNRDKTRTRADGSEGPFFGPHTIIVIDEAHNLVDPEESLNSTQTDGFLQLYKEMLDIKREFGVRFVLMTATPMRSELHRVGALLNLLYFDGTPFPEPDLADLYTVRRKEAGYDDANKRLRDAWADLTGVDPELGVTNYRKVDDFSRMVKGLISFADVSGNRMSFARVDRQDPEEIVMSEAATAEFVRRMAAKRGGPLSAYTMRQGTATLPKKKKKKSSKKKKGEEDDEDDDEEDEEKEEEEEEEEEKREPRYVPKEGSVGVVHRDAREVVDLIDPRRVKLIKQLIPFMEDELKEAWRDAARRVKTLDKDAESALADLTEIKNDLKRAERKAAAARSGVRAAEVYERWCSALGQEAEFDSRERAQPEPPRLEESGGGDAVETKRFFARAVRATLVEARLAEKVLEVLRAFYEKGDRAAEEDSEWADEFLTGDEATTWRAALAALEEELEIVESWTDKDGGKAIKEANKAVSLSAAERLVDRAIVGREKEAIGDIQRACGAVAKARIAVQEAAATHTPRWFEKTRKLKPGKYETHKPEAMAAEAREHAQETFERMFDEFVEERRRYADDDEESGEGGNHGQIDHPASRVRSELDEATRDIALLGDRRTRAERKLEEFAEENKRKLVDEAHKYRLKSARLELLKDFVSGRLAPADRTVLGRNLDVLQATVMREHPALDLDDGDAAATGGEKTAGKKKKGTTRLTPQMISLVTKAAAHDKLEALWANIEKHPETKHWVFTSGKGVAKILHDFLTKKKGWTFIKNPQDYQPTYTKAHGERRAKKSLSDLPGEEGKRFGILPDSGDLTANKAWMSEDGLYNREDNLDGGIVRVLIGTSRFKEGISLLGVGAIHIMEQMPDGDIEQAIMRGVRFNSHRQHYDRETGKSPYPRDVPVWIYRVRVDPKFFSVEVNSWDTFRLSENQGINDARHETKRALVRAAIDCALNVDVMLRGMEGGFHEYAFACLPEEEDPPEGGVRPRKPEIDDKPTGKEQHVMTWRSFYFQPAGPSRPIQRFGVRENKDLFPASAIPSAEQLPEVEVPPDSLCAQFGSGGARALTLDQIRKNREKVLAAFDLGDADTLDDDQFYDASFQEVLGRKLLGMFRMIDAQSYGGELTRVALDQSKLVSVGPRIGPRFGETAWGYTAGTDIVINVRAILYAFRSTPAAFPGANGRPLRSYTEAVCAVLEHETVHLLHHLDCEAAKNLEQRAGHPLLFMRTVYQLFGQDLLYFSFSYDGNPRRCVAPSLVREGDVVLLNLFGTKWIPTTVRRVYPEGDVIDVQLPKEGGKREKYPFYLGVTPRGIVQVRALDGVIKHVHFQYVLWPKSALSGLKSRTPRAPRWYSQLERLPADTTLAEAAEDGVSPPVLIDVEVVPKTPGSPSGTPWEPSGSPGGAKKSRSRTPQTPKTPGSPSGTPSEPSGSPSRRGGGSGAKKSRSLTPQTPITPLSPGGSPSPAPAPPRRPSDSDSPVVRGKRGDGGSNKRRRRRILSSDSD